MAHCGHRSTPANANVTAVSGELRKSATCNSIVQRSAVRGAASTARRMLTYIRFTVERVGLSVFRAAQSAKESAVIMSAESVSHPADDGRGTTACASASSQLEKRVLAVMARTTAYVLLKGAAA